MCVYCLDSKETNHAYHDSTLDPRPWQSGADAWAEAVAVIVVFFLRNRSSNPHYSDNIFEVHLLCCCREELEKIKKYKGIKMVRRYRDKVNKQRVVGASAFKI